MQCVCGVELEAAATGRPRRFCSNACRQRAYRARTPRFPARMRDRAVWVRADGKRPIQPNGSPASTTDPTTWSTFEAVQSGAGDGFGIMLGGGLGCYDLDRMDDVTVREVVASIPERVIFMERSMSGRGVHVFVEASEGRGSRVRRDDGSLIERYSRARFIRVTGERFRL